MLTYGPFLQMNVKPDYVNIQEKNFDFLFNKDPSLTISVAKKITK